MVVRLASRHGGLPGLPKACQMGQGLPRQRLSGTTGEQCGTVRASTKGFAVCKMQTAASAGAVPDTVDPLTRLAIAADLVQQK